MTTCSPELYNNVSIPYPFSPSSSMVQLDPGAILIWNETAVPLRFDVF